MGKVAKIEFASKFSRIFDDTYRFKVFYGGRASGKSMSVGLYLLTKGAKAKHRILCCREIQASIDVSVHRLLVDLNNDYGFGYEYTNTSLTHPVTGTIFTFDGLSANTSKIKGTANYDTAWIEEAATISEDSFEKLFPTIRAANSEIIIVFNPESESDPVYKRFIKPFLHSINSSDDQSFSGTVIDGGHKYLVQKVNYVDNPWCPDVIKQDVAQMALMDPVGHRHIYLGEPVADLENCVINGEWFDACINAHKQESLKGVFSSGGIRVVGYDPSDKKDPHGCVERIGSIVTSITTWVGNLEDGCKKVHMSAITNPRVNELIYDVGGLGVGARIVFDGLHSSCTYRKTPFDGGSAVVNKHALYKGDLKNKVVFLNKRAQFYTLLADRMHNTYRAVKHGVPFHEEDMISFDTDTCQNLDDLRLELTSIKRAQRAGKTLIQIESKRDMKKRGVKSPNLADSLCYAFSSDMNPVEINVPTADFFGRWI